MIEMWSSGKAPRETKGGTATGFFFGREGHHFLVTNRHVIVDEEEHFYPDKIGIYLHNDANDMTRYARLNIDLYGRGSCLWLEHPTIPNVDLIALNIDGYLSSINNPLFMEYEEKNIPSQSDLIDIGCDLVAISYPLGFFDHKNRLPIFRKASLASSYGVGFEGKEVFLVDAILHPGTSGCPIVRPPEAVRMMPDGTSQMAGRHPHQLIGINSGEYSSNGIATNLNVAWYPGLIVDIIDSGKLGTLL